MTPNTPTPETDAYIGEQNENNMTEGEIAMCEFSRRLERERDEARAALSGRTVSCPNCNEAGRTIEAMREAIREACEALSTCKEFIENAHIVEGQWHWEPVRVTTIALTKLQPFITNVSQPSEEHDKP